MSFKKIRIITIVNGILALIVIGMFLLLMRDIVSISLTASKKPPFQSPIKQQKDTSGKGLMDYNPILKNNPFGFYAGALSLLGSKAEGAKIAADVTLVGTVSGHKKFAYAIFADKNNIQEIFKIGASVYGIGKLQGVEKDRVLINDGGKIKEIQIADLITIREVNPSSTKPNASDSFSGEKFAKKMADTSYLVDGQKVQQAITNPNQIMTDARLVPNIIDGRQDGFALREVRQGGIYQSLGLQNGDILLRINEYNISNPEAALQAFTALKGMDRVQLDIIRNGAKMTMTYQIR